MAVKGTIAKENIIKKAVNDYTVNLANVPEKEKWDILSKELTQKQEIIHRMMKEVDDKTESLKLTGAEIVELRKQIKLLQNENQILRRRLGQEEQMQIESLVTQEIHKMSLPELKSKIIKLAQAYRGERLRNEEFEKALRQAQNEIANARKLANDLEQLQKVHEEDSEKFLNLQKETQKIGLYRETIKKQEEVITKMEGLLKKTMHENERQKDSLLELEQLRTENLKLQKEIKDFVVNSTPGVLGRGNIELEKSKKEITRLQTIINELQNDLSNKRPISAEKKELQNDSQIEEEETSPSPKNINNINMNTNNQIIEQKKEEEEPKEKIKKNDSKKSNKISKSKKEIKINSKSDNAIKETKPKMTNLLNIPINKPVRVDKIFKLNVIYFEMKYDTQMGENIAVIGSIDRLGNWDTSRVLNLKWNEGNVWGASLDYNEINDFEYKFIFVKDGYVKEWEDGINRKFIFQQIKSLIEPNLINGNIIRLKNIMSQSLEYDFNNYSLKIISEWNKK